MTEDTHSPQDQFDVADVQRLYESLATEIDQVLIGNDDIIENLTIAALVRGHVLLEGVPGVAKTTIATLFARATGLDHRRVQMTPDILPADITGSNIYKDDVGAFELQRGPVFTNLLIADEINRATPKTQSALLEAMQEGQVSIEGETLSLPTPFLVVATQNPVEMEGVFELPEAQRDRFQFKLTVDLLERSLEHELLKRFKAQPELGAGEIESVVDPQELLAARNVVATVHVAEAIEEYILDIVAASRTHQDVVYGASPRAAIAFLNGARARAAVRGREYVIPDDVKALATPTLTHRLVLSTDAELSNVSPSVVIEEILESVTAPGAESIEADAEAPR